MKLVKIFGIELSNEIDNCDECERIKRRKFSRTSLSLRHNEDNDCFCVYKKYYFLGFEVIHAKKTFKSLERAEDEYLERCDQLGPKIKKY